MLGLLKSKTEIDFEWPLTLPRNTIFDVHVACCKLFRLRRGIVRLIVFGGWLTWHVTNV
jgi:hypothetical protein